MLVLLLRQRMSSPENEVSKYLYKPLSFASKDHLRSYVDSTVKLFNNWKVPFYLVISLMKDANNTDFEHFFRNESLTAWITQFLSTLDGNEYIESTLIESTGLPSDIGAACYLILLYLMIEIKKSYCVEKNPQNESLTKHLDSLIGYFVGNYKNEGKVIDIASFLSRAYMKKIIPSEKNNYTTILLTKSLNKSVGGCLSFTHPYSVIEKDQCNLNCVVDNTTNSVVFKVGERIIVMDEDKSNNFVITSASNARQLILSFRVNSLYQRVWVLISNYSSSTPSKVNDYFGYITETPKLIHTVSYDDKNSKLDEEDLEKELVDDRPEWKKIGSYFWSNWSKNMASAQFYMFGLDRV